MFSNNKDKITGEEISKSSNSIGKGTVLNGDIETLGNIRIEGKVNGNIKTKSKVVVGAPAKVDGNLLAQNAEIAGEIKGLVEVSDLLILKPTAVIHGDINTNKLVIESGATFNGACKMGAAVKEMGGEKDKKSSKPADKGQQEVKTA